MEAVKKWNTTKYGLDLDRFQLNLTKSQQDLTRSSQIWKDLDNISLDIFKKGISYNRYLYFLLKWY